MRQDFEIGDTVRYLPGYRGYYLATLTGFSDLRYVITFSSGAEITCHADEIEEA